MAYSSILAVTRHLLLAYNPREPSRTVDNSEGAMGVTKSMKDSLLPSKRQPWSRLVVEDGSCRFELRFFLNLGGNVGPLTACLGSCIGDDQHTLE